MENQQVNSMNDKKQTTCLKICMIPLEPHHQVACQTLINIPSEVNWWPNPVISLSLSLPLLSINFSPSLLTIDYFLFFSPINFLSLSLIDFSFVYWFPSLLSISVSPFCLLISFSPSPIDFFFSLLPIDFFLSFTYWFLSCLIDLTLSLLSIDFSCLLISLSLLAINLSFFEAFVHLLPQVTHSYTHAHTHLIDFELYIVLSTVHAQLNLSTLLILFCKCVLKSDEILLNFLEII